MPLFFSDYLDICDLVLTFDRFMEGINLKQCLKKLPRHRIGRLRYHPVKMLKTVLFGFMSEGYISLRQLEDNCKVNLRYMYLMGHETPSYRTFGYFINEVLGDSVEALFHEINHAIFETEHVDLSHLYIDGTKLEANADKYTWVWKKASEKARYRLYGKISALLEEINADLAWNGLQIPTNTEYIPEQLREYLQRYMELTGIELAGFVHGRGHRKTIFQRRYERLLQYTEKLEEYVEKLSICGSNRNSYSKTDHSATFMRVKSDYMGNGQLLPTYNIQVGVCDEYVAVVNVKQYRTDMDCFVSLLETFRKIYGFYPKYSVADAGYGSYNNYLYCEQHGMEKYMKFPMYAKETKDKKYRNNPFRAINFQTDKDGTLRCPNGKVFHFAYRQNVRGNRYGRQEEVYECEDCSACPYAETCKKTNKNRTIRLNEELTKIHQEVLNNLESIQGALLRRNRSIQAEGTFGIMKKNRWYQRIVRKGLDSVRLEIFLVFFGQNLYKYHNKKRRVKQVA